MNYLKLQQSFLKLFGTPYCKLIPDDEDTITKLLNSGSMKSNFKPLNKYRKLEILNQINDEYPFQVHFSPNGNYGEKATKDGVVVGCKDSEHGNGPLRHAFHIDLDLKDTSYKSMEKFFEEGVSPLLEGAIPSFVASSKGGFHVYYLFKEEEWEDIERTYSLADMAALTKFIIGQFPGGDTAGARLKVNAFLRLPYTLHKKDPKDHYRVTLFKYFKGMKFDDIKDNTITDPKEFDEINRIGKREIAILYDTWQQDNKVKKQAKKRISKQGSVLEMSVNELDMRKVINKLSDYPYERAFTVNGIGGGRTNIIGRPVLEAGSNVYIRDIKTDHLYPTDGYKLNVEQNYVNNFSTSAEEVAKRPKGEPFNFIDFYFNNNVPLYEDFLFKEFGIKASVETLADGEQILHEYESPNRSFSVIFTNTRVHISKITNAGNKSHTKMKELFDFPLNIKSRSRTNVTQDYTETDTKNMVYLVENHRGETVMLTPVPTKRKFNEKYQNSLGFCMGDDNDIGMFFQALENINVPEVEFRYLGGYYKDGVYFLGNKVHSSGLSNAIEYFKDTFPLNDKKHINVEKYIKKVSKVFKKEISIISVLSTCALVGMNIWPKEGNLSPGVFYTGETKSGKTTLVDFMRNMIGISIPETGEKPREWDVNSITAKPLKQAATQYEPLFITEMTGKVDRSKGATFRNILNKEGGSRGTSGTKNESYVFRSSLLVQGESLAEEASINNRMMIINMKQDYWVTKKDKEGRIDMKGLEDLDKYTCYKEIFESIHKYFLDYESFLLLLKEAREQLKKADISGRDQEIWAFVLVMNKIIWTGLKDDEVIKAIKFCIKTSGGNEEIFVKDIGPAFKLKELFMQEVIRNRCIARRYEHIDNDTILYEISFINKFINNNAGIISNLATEINELVGEPCIKVKGNTILIKVIESKYGEALDLVLRQVFTLVKMKNVEHVEDMAPYRGS